MRVFISPVPTLASTPTLHVAMNTTQHHRHQLPTQCLFFFTSSMGLFLLSFSSYMRRPRGSPVIGEHSEYFVTNRSRFAYMAIFKSGCTLIDSPPPMVTNPTWHYANDCRFVLVGRIQHENMLFTTTTTTTFDMQIPFVLYKYEDGRVG